jgi:uncharacterized sulfatase
MKTQIQQILVKSFGFTVTGCITAAPIQASAHLIQENETQNKPNIILIYADDLGYSDAGCYGREYGNNFTETPNIDRLAAEGMKFTSAYSSAPICSPSRAALLTGKSPARLGFEFVTKYEKDTFSWNNSQWKAKYADKKLCCPPYTLTLPLEELTVAEQLKQNGYTTGIVGKWHVAPHHNFYNGWSLSHGPIQQGFNWAEETFGAFGQSKKDTIKKYQKGEYPEDELTNKAIEFVCQKHQKPFFLFVSHYFVHTPIGNRPEWLIEKYRQKAAGSGEEISENKILYAAFVERLDHYVGQLLNAVDSAGLVQNTIIVFTSDNGGHPVYAYNRPFRGSKWNLYEGGVREPFIVRWPGVIKEGSICDTPVMQTDLMPTFCEQSGQQESQEDHIDGISILPLLRGEKSPAIEGRTMVWHFPYYHPEEKAYYEAENEIGVEDGYVSQTVPQSSIRKGNFKLIYFYEDDRVELYDLSEDISECNDLSQSRPWDAKRLKDELFNYLEKVEARYPRRNLK